MVKEDVRVIRTKSNLHKAIIAILRNKPLAEVTVTELCIESEITRRTFYLHYESEHNYLKNAFNNY